MPGPIRIAILANGTQAKREIGSVSSSIGRLGKLARGGLAAAGFAGLTAGAIGFARSAVQAESAYSTTMRLIAASTKATAREMSAMDKAAMELGANTQFSASEAADAMLELAKAGLSTKTILKGGVAGTLQLAAAGGTELGTAATIASNALNTFNLQGRDMAKVAAALAGGANASSASVESLGQGLQQVGPGAINAGLSLQETVAALSAFDAAGIKGSDAGTSLKTMLSRLVPQTDKASEAMEQLGIDFVKGNGEFESLANIAEQLQRRMGKLSAAERTVAMNRIFGSDATRAATVLMKEGADGIKKFTRATQDQNAAQEMAEARMSGTEGALERLGGAVETAQLKLGKKLAPVVEATADRLADNMEPALDRVIEGAQLFGRAVEPLVDVLKLAGSAAVDAAQFLDGLPGPVKEIGIQAGIAALVLPRLTASITGATGAVSLQIIKLQQLRAELSYTATRGQALSGVFGRIGGVAKQAAGIGGIMALTSGFTEASQEGTTFSSVMKGVAGGAGIGAMFGPVGALIGGVAGGGLTALTGVLHDTRAGAEKTRLELLKLEGFKNAKADADSLAQALQGVVNEYSRVPRAAVEASFTGKDGKLDKDVAKLRELGVSMDTIVSATMGQVDAQKVVDKALTGGAATAEQYAQRAYEAYIRVRDGVNEYRDAQGSVVQQPFPQETIEAARKAWEDAKKPVEDLSAAHETFRERVHQNANAISDHRRQIKELAGDLGLTVKRYHALPKRVRTRVEGAGLPQTSRDALRLVNQYKGLQKFRQIKALISAPGVQLSVKQIENLQRTYKLTPKQVKTLFKLEGVKPSENEAKRGGRNVAENLKRETRKAKADLNGFRASIATGTNTAEGVASQGGHEVGAALKAGVIAGFAGTQQLLAGNAAAAVRAAVAAAKSAGKVRSPSRETFYIGDMLGRGLVEGMNARGKDSEKSGKKLVERLLAGVVNGSQGVDQALQKITNLVEKRIRFKNDKKEERRERQALKHLRDEYAALRKNAKAQDALRDGNYLTYLSKSSQLFKDMTAAGVKNLGEARQLLQEMQREQSDYAAGIRDSFVEFGNIVNLGRQEASSSPWVAGARGAAGVSLSGLITDLQDRAKAAEEFDSVIRSLEGMSLNETTVKQLLAAGPEAALATAQAIASGGSAAIAQINSLTAQIGTLGKGLGDTMAEEFYGAGVRAAQGLVDGLEAEDKALDRAARKLARALAKAVRKELDIKSPSRVFREIGDQTIQGLTLGLDETYVHRQGQQLAGRLVSGFGTPALDAYMSTSVAGSAPQPVALSEAQLDRLAAKLSANDAQTAALAGASAGAASTATFVRHGNKVARRRRRDGG